MIVTPDDIRREHEEAMASLTDEQRHGLWRRRHAHQMTNFNGLSSAENLEIIFEQEARERNEEDAERDAAAIDASANDNTPRGPAAASSPEAAAG